MSIRLAKAFAISAVATAALSACVSLGSEAPVSLLTLSADNSVAAGTSKSGAAKDALVVLAPEVPRKLDTNRVPVQIDAGNVAYLKDSVWTDKPAILMQQLLAETLSAKNGTLILSEVETAGKAERYLSGQLVEFGIDEGTMEAVVVLDAVHIRKGGAIDKRRFEAREAVSEIKPRPAGEALNTAANKLAGEVATWLSSD
ncbi:MAG: ABC-type transport auxiliary lipoprotein family protein [Sphingorhabdus sp.]